MPAVQSSSVLLALLIAVLGFVAITPIALVIGHSIIVTAPDGSLHLGFDAWARAFSEPGIVTAILNTLRVTAVVQLISFPIGILLAWLVGRTDLPGRRWLEFGFWMSFLLPALGTTTGWILVFDPDYGIANQALRGFGFGSPGPIDIYSYPGIVFVHLATFSISTKVILLAPAFRNLDSSLEEASRVCGGGMLRSLRSVVLPVLTPALLVVFLMALIRGLEAFEIELILGRPFDFSVYSTKMYQLLRNSPPDYAAATVLATSILLLLVPLIAFERWMSNRRSYVTVTGRQRRDLTRLGPWRWPAFAFTFAFVLLLTVAPVVFQAMGSLMSLFGFFDVPNVWTLRHWQNALADRSFTRALGNTMVIGLGTVAAALAVFSIVAYTSVRLRQRWRGLLDVFSWLPFTIPGVILGLGVLWLVLGVSFLQPLYGSMILLIVVGWIAAMTLSVQLFKTGFLQLGRELEEASHVAGGSWLRTIRSIDLPLIMPAMMVVGMMVFAATARQVGALVFLITGETQPLSVLQLGLLYGSELGQAAVVGTVIVLLSVGVALVARFIEARFSRHR